MADVIEKIRALDLEHLCDESQRATAVNELYSLLARVESPIRRAWHLSVVVPTQLACLKIAIDLKLFHRWLESHNGAPASFPALALLVPECGSQLFLRIIRVLSATHVLQVNVDKLYEMSSLAKSLGQGNTSAIIDCCFELVTPAALNAPTFLAATQYDNPTGGELDNFKDFSGATIWKYLSERPSMTANLHHYMTATGTFRGTWSAIYTPAAQLTGTEDDILVVDIGGSAGHDLQAFRKNFPDAIGKLVLQDLPDVINKATDLDSSILKMGYDFFTEQSVKGARIYHLHSVLHDWPDSDATRILQIIQRSMHSEYSKLLIQEVVIPDVGADIYSAVSDWTMMSLASGRERSETEWYSLLNLAGFDIIKIWRTSAFTEAVIECKIII